MPNEDALSDANKDKLSRKEFLKIVACAGVAGAGTYFGFKGFHRPRMTSENRVIMGTIVNITLIGTSRQSASQAIQNCFGTMERLEAVLSLHRRTSQLSVLNRKGNLVDPHPALLHIISLAQEISLRSRGAFDITVKPLLDLYRNRHKKYHQLPTSNEIRETRNLIGYTKLEAGNGAINFQKTGMAITLDGIAKGYIVDRGIQSLLKSGYSQVLVEAGGDLYASGSKKRGHPWQIGIQHPRPAGSQRFLTSIPVSNIAVTTSGDYHQAFSRDFRANHIMDPRTGYSPPDLASVTVLAPTTLLADALSTALMVMGRDNGRDLIENWHDCEAQFVSKDLKIHNTTGFPDD